MVAPFTGAWIEICLDELIASGREQVAPFTGAWIEMSRVGLHAGFAHGSHPSRVRGLKCLLYGYGWSRDGQVAPFTGAWIEIKDAYYLGIAKAVSHPSRVRGLK